MIGDVLVFLRDHLNAYLRSSTGVAPDDAAAERVVFLNGDSMDSITFQLGAVTALLINLEEDNALRPPDPYTALARDGTQRRVRPDIRLNLYVLFVARFAEYQQGLNYLSRIIQHFQVCPVFDSHSAPDLNENIERLVVEMITLPLSEQNELWNSLRATYHPSVLYKVKMVVLRDEEAMPVAEIRESILRTRRIPS